MPGDHGITKGGKGEQGERGEDGLNGEMLPGDRGMDGQPGPRGVKGNRGDQGLTGKRGIILDTHLYGASNISEIMYPRYSTATVAGLLMRVVTKVDMSASTLLCTGKMPKYRISKVNIMPFVKYLSLIHI